MKISSRLIHVMTRRNANRSLKSLLFLVRTSTCQYDCLDQEPYSIEHLVHSSQNKRLSRPPLTRTIWTSCPYLRGFHCDSLPELFGTTEATAHLVSVVGSSQCNCCTVEQLRCARRVFFELNLRNCIDMIRGSPTSIPTFLRSCSFEFPSHFQSTTEKRSICGSHLTA